MSPAAGFEPSVQFLREQKLYNVVSSPVGVIRKTVPHTPAIVQFPTPPDEVVP